MSVVSREQIMTALFTLLSGAYAFQTASRRPVTEANLPSTQMPALFLLDDDEEHKRSDQITPAVRTFTAHAWIFTAAGQDPSVIPVTILNTILDAIDPITDGVLAPNALTNRQTLGGLVYDCWIEGKIIKDPGVISGLGFAHIPINIVVP